MTFIKVTLDGVRLLQYLYVLTVLVLQCFLDFKRSVLLKLETIIQKQDGLSIMRVLLDATRGVGGNDILDDVLPKPAECDGDIQILCGRLGEENLKENGMFFYLLSEPYLYFKIEKPANHLLKQPE